MCWMEYEIQGKTENWLKLEKDGEGVELLGEKLIFYKSFRYLKEIYTFYAFQLQDYFWSMKFKKKFYRLLQ